MQDMTRLCQQEHCLQLHREGYYSRVAVRKTLITQMNAHLTVQWCKNHGHLSTEMWKKVIWSDESFFSIFSTSGWVREWYTLRERNRPECLTPTVKRCGGSIIFWHALLVPLEGGVTANQSCSVTALLQVYNAPCGVAEWFGKYENDVNHIDRKSVV